MEQIDNNNAMAPQMSPEEAEKLLALNPDGIAVTDDAAEPTEAERVIN